MIRALVTSAFLAVPSVAFAGACPSFTATPDSAVTATMSGTTMSIPLGGLELHGIDPDEIDLQSTCTPTLGMEGLELHGIDPDEIDFTLSLDLSAGGTAQTREHVLLARQVGVPSLMTTTGSLTWTATSVTLREEVVSRRPYVAVVVADITFALSGATADLRGATPVYAEMPSSVDVTSGAAVVSDVPRCTGCP